ncbi:hypothetical protein AB0P15_27615 [Streptomyces sp. NPDC087917]|uniref:hypothetical protein n=1 Tax=Streptomyces sp. NPDC087917 TaxID=3155060 RepID=UPI0034405FBD
MNNVDPVAWIVDHREAIIRWSIMLGAAFLVFLLIRYFAMRLGGWRAAWRRLMRELALTGAAFASPVRAWLRYRRVLRMLVRRMGDSESWRDAERALAAARLAAAPALPYAALVDDSHVSVLLAGHRLPAPPAPWEADEDVPGQWSVPRSELPAVVPGAGLNRPVIVAIGGEDGPYGRCAFLDTASGPPAVALDGDRRAGTALLPALAVQLGVRLPTGQVIVAKGVHRGFQGEPVREAYRAAKDTPTRLGIAPVLVTPELPDPLPPELAGRPQDVPRLRVLVLGPGRGYVRRLYADRHGQLVLPGTPLLLMAHALPKAVARTLKRIPPVHPPAPAGESALGVFVESEDADADVDVSTGAGEAERDPDAGVVTTPGGAVAPGPGRTALPEPRHGARRAGSAPRGTSAAAAPLPAAPVPATAGRPAAEPVADPDAGVAPAHRTGAASGTGTGSGPGSGAAPEVGSGAGSGAPDGSAPASRRAPDPGSPPAPDPDSGPHRDPDADPAPDPDADPTPGPAPSPSQAGPPATTGAGTAPAGPVIWAGSDVNPGVWTGLVGAPPRPRPGTDPRSPSAEPPGPDPTAPGPDPDPAGDRDRSGDRADGTDPDAGVPTGPNGPHGPHGPH